MYESFLTTQGGTVSIAGTLRGADGKPVLNTYTGSEPLLTSVWPGGPAPASFLPTTAWIDPPAGTFLVAISADETNGLQPGTYQGVTRLNDAGATPDAYYFTLTVANAPGGLPVVPTATAITRLVLEIELIDRDSALLVLCGKSVIADGNNRHLTGALGASLQLLGITPAIPGVVSDADLAKVPNSKYFVLLDLAEYRLIKNLLGSFAQPDQTSGNTKILLNKMMDRFRSQMLDIEKQYASYLGTARATLSSGTIRVRRPTPAPTDASWWQGGGGDF